MNCYTTLHYTILQLCYVMLCCVVLPYTISHYTITITIIILCYIACFSSSLFFIFLKATELLELFSALDMDFSGTVSFSEFVQGLAAIRVAHEQELQAF